MTHARSLRSRVAIAAAVGATIIVTITYLVAFAAIERYNLDQVDRRLATASRLVLLDPGNVARYIAATRAPVELVFTVRRAETTTSTGVELPVLPAGKATITVDGTVYRVITVPRERLDDVVSLGLPLDEVNRQISQQRRHVLIAGIVAIAAAAGLGWALGGRALRPIARLTAWVHEHPQAGPPPRSGVPEADELSDALASMHKQSTAALHTARDFAAAAAHELRTPLTAMRTNIDVLRSLDLDADARREVLDDVARTQDRVEATLRALEQLAAGELKSPDSRVPTDLSELCDRAAHDAARTLPGLTVELDVDADLIVNGFPAGLRLILDNALLNAHRHGTAGRAVISAHRSATGGVVLAVDDDGIGVPPHDRERVFDRFVRGSGTAPGSGLGLSLVAQQAALHGGHAYLEDSRLGGARLVVELN